MHRDDRPAVLLNLLLPQRQIGDERYVEVFFNHGFFQQLLFRLFRITIGYPAERAKFDNRLRCLFGFCEYRYLGYPFTMPTMEFNHI